MLANKIEITNNPIKIPDLQINKINNDSLENTTYDDVLHRMMKLNLNVETQCVSLVCNLLNVDTDKENTDTNQNTSKSTTPDVSLCEDENPNSDGHEICSSKSNAPSPVNCVKVKITGSRKVRKNKKRKAKSREKQTETTSPNKPKRKNHYRSFNSSLCVRAFVIGKKIHRNASKILKLLALTEVNKAWVTAVAQAIIQAGISDADRDAWQAQAKQLDQSQRVTFAKIVEQFLILWAENGSPPIESAAKISEAANQKDKTRTDKDHGFQDKETNLEK